MLHLHTSDSDFVNLGSNPSPPAKSHYRRSATSTRAGDAAFAAVSTIISKGCRKSVLSSPPFQEQFETTKSSRRRFSRASRCSNSRRHFVRVRESVCLRPNRPGLPIGAAQLRAGIAAARRATVPTFGRRRQHRRDRLACRRTWHEFGFADDHIPLDGALLLLCAPAPRQHD